MRRFIQVALLTCLLLAVAAPAGAERRIALVIGNGAYKAAPLKNPVNDARDMAASLKRLGFDVTLLTDAGQQQMDAAVREFGLKLRQGGAGLFYYAGHGLQVAGENYLVPVNANIQTESDVRYTCLPAGMVLGKMEDARNDLNIIILDACRNNPFARSFRGAEPGLAKMDAPTGSLISYATAPGSVASDGQGKNGLFTQHLLRNMATPGLPITEVFMRVRQSVVAETKRKQVPWEASSLIGQFYFSGTAADQPPLPATVAAVAPAPAPALAKPLDLKAEKKRVAEEAARLKREQQELAQLQSLQAEKDRLEAERQKLEQAKLLALAPRPKQPPQAPQAAASSAPQAKAHAAQFAQLARAGLPDARAYFEQAVQARPEDMDARAGLAIALVFSGREADAKYQVQRLNESGAQTAGVRLAKGLLLGLEGTADASYQLNRAVEEGADRALALLCQAAAAGRKKEYGVGHKLMAEYATLVAENGRGEFALKLARQVDLLGRLAGTYLHELESGYSGDTVITFSRNGDSLTAATSGGSVGGNVPVDITNLTLKGDILSFHYNFLIGLFGIGGRTVKVFTCDISGALEMIPCTVTFAGQSSNGDKLVRMAASQP